MFTGFSPVEPHVIEMFNPGTTSFANIKQRLLVAFGPWFFLTLFSDSFSNQLSSHYSKFCFKYIISLMSYTICCVSAI